MRKGIALTTLVIALIYLLSGCSDKKSVIAEDVYSGSESCKECHERFYSLWSPSHHGKAMQPINRTFLKNDSIPESPEFELEGKFYQILLKDSLMAMVEKTEAVVSEYPVVWALGGKNVFYFLTLLEQGKLQTIPLAYDVGKKAWYNNPESAVRHFPDGAPDEALPWRDRAYTFNTSCYSCHVSQLNTNYTLESDSYLTTWKEPGINCETCHGPSAEHVRVCRDAKEGTVPEDLKIIITKTFTPEQHNASCSPCHAKMHPITSSYLPGDRYFDNYNLTTLEHSDFYPDGRDLGENYTMTSWSMNTCAMDGKMHCVTCHTSSGRTRHTGNESNQLCLPCHQGKVENVEQHTFHKIDSEGSKCVNCHMPKTEFGRMVRSDHSFRPPMPGATLEFGSPNACNLCHQNQTPQWASQWVKNRNKKGYQEETLYWGKLIREARENHWENLDKMVKAISDDTFGEVVTNSLVRLLVSCEKEMKWEAVFAAMHNVSPLVRSSAASGLSGNFSEKARSELLAACLDEYRLVRIAAALTLSAFPENVFSEAEKMTLAKAVEEYRSSIVSRPDDWSAHYNMGIFYQNRGELSEALNSYETSSRLYSESILPLINSSVLYSYIGNKARAEESLLKAIHLDPENEAANLNLGLLLAEQGRTEEAKQALLKVMEHSPQQAVAAYNLSVLFSDTDIQESVRWAESAALSAPGNPKYGYTLAFFQNQAGQVNLAIQTLREVTKNHPDDINSVYLLAELYLQKQEKDNALKVYESFLRLEQVSLQEKSRIQELILRLKEE